MGPGYCVCLCLCPSVCLLVRTSAYFRRVFRVTVARSSSVGVAVRYVHVLPVLWMTSRFHRMTRMAACRYHKTHCCNRVHGLTPPAARYWFRSALNDRWAQRLDESTDPGAENAMRHCLSLRNKVPTHRTDSGMKAMTHRILSPRISGLV